MLSVPRMMRTWAAILVCVLAVGCGDDSGNPGSGGSSGAGGSSGSGGSGGTGGTGGTGGMSGSGGTGGSAGIDAPMIDAGPPDAVMCGNCDDGNPCTADACDTSTGQCTHTPTSGGTCNDNNACTSGDHCVNGACSGSPVNCDDANPCTDDACNTATGCVHTNNTAACSDGNACTVNDVCAGGVCVPGAARVCNDGNPCTADSCNPATGCVFTNDDTVCCAGNHQCRNGACSTIICQ